MESVITILGLVIAAGLHGPTRGALQATVVHSHQQVRDAATSQELAIQLALRGVPAGLVLELPPHLEPRPTRFEMPAGERTPRSAGFDAWQAELALAFGSLHTGVLAKPQSPGEVIAAFVSGRSAEQFVSERPGPAVHLVRSARASACTAALRSRLSSDVAGRDPVAVILAALRHSTHATVPGGVVGSCIADTSVPATGITIRKGTRLEDALNHVATAAGASVWVAIQAPTGECSLGLVQRATTPERVCATTLTDDLLRASERGR